MDGGGSAGIGDAGGSASQRRVADLEGEAQLTRLEGPQGRQEGGLSGDSGRTDWRPAGKVLSLTADPTAQDDRAAATISAMVCSNSGAPPNRMPRACSLAVTIWFLGTGTSPSIAPRLP